MSYTIAHTLNVMKGNAANVSQVRGKECFHATNTSTVSTEVGMGIFCERAAKTNPAWSRTTMPRPAEDWVENIASLKFTFTIPGGGGFQRTERAVLGIFE